MAEENKKKQGVSSYSSTCPPPHTAPAPGPLDTSPPMLSGAPRRAVPCWVSPPAAGSRSICPFQRQNDRQSILFLMTSLPEQGCVVRGGSRRERTP